MDIFIKDKTYEIKYYGKGALILNNTDLPNNRGDFY